MQKTNEPDEMRNLVSRCHEHVKTENFFCRQANWGGQEWMEPLKNKLIQARLSENELADFEEVKREFGVAGNSKAMRQMIQDEKMLMKAKNDWHNDNRDAVTALVQQLNDQGRLPLVQALYGLTNTKSSSELSIVRDQYADIQQQLQAIMYTITKSGNNLNQIAHVLNAAKQQAEQEDDDLTDDDLWRWVAKQLVENSRVLVELQQEIINLKNDTGSSNQKAGGTVVSPGNSLMS